MKKLHFAVIISFILFAAVLGIYYSKPDSISENAVSLGSIDSINQLVKSSDTVVSASVKQISDFQGSVGQQILFTVNETVKGSEENEIYVYAENSLLNAKEGESFILFLDRFDSAVYPHPVYSIIDYNSSFKVSMGLLSAPSKKGENLIGLRRTENAMLGYISSLPEAAENTDNPNNIVDSFTSIEEMFEYSDKVSLVKVTYYKKYHEYMSGIKVENLENFKGEPLGSEGEFDIPADVDVSVGQELIMFLRKSDEGPYFLSARNGAVVSETSEDFESTLNILRNIK